MPGIGGRSADEQRVLGAVALDRRQFGAQQGGYIHNKVRRVVAVGAAEARVSGKDRAEGERERNAGGACGRDGGAVGEQVRRMTVFAA
jgi:hypothetical protein